MYALGVYGSFARRDGDSQSDIDLIVADDESAAHATVAVGNGVLAGIAVADAICCEAVGERYRGDDHRQAARHIGQVTSDGRLERALRALRHWQGAD